MEGRLAGASWELSQLLDSARQLAVEVGDECPIWEITYWKEMAAQLEEWTVVATTTASSAAGRATDRRWPSWLWCWAKLAHSLQARLRPRGRALQCFPQMMPPPRPPWEDSESDAEGEGGSHRWGFPSTTHKGCGRGEWCPARIAFTTSSGSQRTQPGSKREGQTPKSTMEAGLPDPQAPPLDMSTRTTLGCEHVACSLMATSTPTPTNPARCRGCGETFAAELESTGAPSSLRADATEKAGRRGEGREPRWGFEERSDALTRVLRPKPIVPMREAMQHC